jgi:L-xylulose reductase
VIARRMLADNVRDGVFVNVSSQASKVALANHTAYCTSKAALNQLTQMMALELAPFGIRSNAVAPTVVLTDSQSLFFSSIAYI